MRTTTLSRRTWLRNTLHLAVVGAAPLMLQSCKKAEFSCLDVSGLSERDAELRAALEYVDRSPYEGVKSCANCAFFVAGKKDECGQCTLVKGPIHRLGHCNSWAAKG
jgi:hypothetical protein